MVRLSFLAISITIVCRPCCVLVTGGGLGQRSVEREGRKIHAHDIRERSHTEIWMNKCLEFPKLLLGFPLSPSYDWYDARHHGNRTWRPAVLNGACLQVSVKFSRRLDLLLYAEYDLGGARCEFTAGIGLTSLNDDGLPLRRASDHQRSSHRKMLTFVVEHVELSWVEKGALEFCRE